MQPARRIRTRTRYNWAAIVTVIVALLVGICIGMAVQFAVMSPLLDMS